MSQNDTSDDESNPPQMYLKPNSHARNNSVMCSPISPSSSVSSSVIFGQISEEVLRAWSQLPEAIRLDPSLAIFQKECDRITETRSLDCVKKECLVVNMSLGMSPATSISIQHQNVDEDGQDVQIQEKQKPFCRYIKLIILSCCWLLFTMILMFKNERIETMHQLSVSSRESTNYRINEHVTNTLISVTMKGPLLPLRKHEQYLSANLSICYLMVWLQVLVDRKTNSRFSITDSKNLKNVSDVWILPVLPENLASIFPDQKHRKIFHIKADSKTLSQGIMFINLRTNSKSILSLSIGYDSSPINVDIGIPLAAVVLIILYILIIFEVVHKALAAMLASTMSIAILAALNERPSMSELISWIDMDTLLLLFSMMILVANIAETGVFDWLAVYAYKITAGRLWPLIMALCFFAAFLSSLLDNVTTILLMTPVTIRLCEIMELNPVPILTAMVIYSNIGSGTTPIGDPSNVIIASNQDVKNAEIDFSTFVLHMSIGVILVLIIVSAQIRYIFRDVAVLRFDEPQDVQELRHTIVIWQRAAASLSTYSKDENLVRETLLKKVKRLLSQLKKKLITGSAALEKDKWLLIKSGCVLAFVITIFFLHSLLHLHVSLGWIALLGVLLLLILVDNQDFDGLMARVEWGTLLFFASLFILMEALSRLGIISWIGQKTQDFILSVNEESRLAVAILLMLWVSALASCFVDNVSLTTMMVRIATNLAQNRELSLPMQPLIWALAFGACMGGNGTLIGATANVICSSLAEQHGYKFNFMQFFRVGFPIMLTSTITIMVYLMVVHVVFDWNGK
ncbi:P protein, partial [Acromyrmex insinuator]